MAYPSAEMGGRGGPRGAGRATTVLRPCSTCLPTRTAFIGGVPGSMARQLPADHRAGSDVIRRSTLHGWQLGCRDIWNQLPDISWRRRWPHQAARSVASTGMAQSMMPIFTPAGPPGASRGQSAPSAGRSSSQRRRRHPHPVVRVVATPYVDDECAGVAGRTRLCHSESGRLLDQDYRRWSARAIRPDEALGALQIAATMHR